jgi:site-specific recombinase XerD
MKKRTKLLWRKKQLLNQGLLEKFLLSLHGRSKNTQQTYTPILKRFIFAMPEIITLKHIEQYRNSLIDKYKYKPASVKLFMTVIRSFSNFMAKQEHENIAKHLTIKYITPSNQRILTQSEYETVCLKISNKEHLACFQFLCNTGLSVSEFIGLTEANIRNGFLMITGKGTRCRAIPLNQTTKDILDRYPNFEFIKKKNRLWVFRLCKLLAKESGIAEFSPASCRHY